MRDWNVVASVDGPRYDEALRFLGTFGEAARTEFFNIAVLRVADHARFVVDMAHRLEEEPTISTLIVRVIPAVETFTFTSPEEFEEKARSAITAWIPTLAGKTFHVRMHRRGFKGRLSSMQEEQFLDEYLLAALEQYGRAGKITFTDPDAILAIETVGTRAGLSLWTREELVRYPFLKLD